MIFTAHRLTDKESEAVNKLSVEIMHNKYTLDEALAEAKKLIDKWNARVERGEGLWDASGICHIDVSPWATHPPCDGNEVVGETRIPKKAK